MPRTSDPGHRPGHHQHQGHPGRRGGQRHRPRLPLARASPTRSPPGSSRIRSSCGAPCRRHRRRAWSRAACRPATGVASPPSRSPTSARPTLVWERSTGRPLGPCDRLAVPPHAPLLRRAARAGPGAAPAPAHRPDHRPDVLGQQDPLAARHTSPTGSARAEAGEICLGTVDAWLLWNLTGGAVLACDYDQRLAHPAVQPAKRWTGTPSCWRSSASRAPCLPEPSGRRAASSARPSRCGRLPAGIPIASLIGDSHAALYGHAGFQPGRGQGHLRHRLVADDADRRAGALRTRVCRPRSPGATAAGEPYLCAGRQHLRHRRGRAVAGRSCCGWPHPGTEVEALARQVPDNDGVYFVPALGRAGRAALERRRARPDLRAHPRHRPRRTWPAPRSSRSPTRCATSSTRCRPEAGAPLELAAGRRRRQPQRPADAVPGRHRRLPGAPQPVAGRLGAGRGLPGRAWPSASGRPKPKSRPCPARRSASSRACPPPSASACMPAGRMRWTGRCCEGIMPGCRPAMHSDSSKRKGNRMKKTLAIHPDRVVVIVLLGWVSAGPTPSPSCRLQQMRRPRPKRSLRPGQLRRWNLGQQDPPDLRSEGGRPASRSDRHASRTPTAWPPRADLIKVAKQYGLITVGEAHVYLVKGEGK